MIEATFTKSDARNLGIGVIWGLVCVTPLWALVVWLFLNWGKV